MQYAMIAVLVAAGSLAGCGGKETLEEFTARCTAASGTVVDVGGGYFKCVGVDGAIAIQPK